MPDYSHTNPLVPPEEVKAWLDAMPQPIALTGGTGFVGSHLVDTLCAAGIEAPSSRPRSGRAALDRRRAGTLGRRDAG